MFKTYSGPLKMKIPEQKHKIFMDDHDTLLTQHPLTHIIKQ
jgi:hypothetical protein